MVEAFTLDSDGFTCSRVCEEPEVWRVKLAMARTFLPSVNVHVVLDAGEALIVDAGTCDDFNDTRLMRALVRLGVDPARATVFCTHSHNDHTGLARELADTGARLVMSKRSLVDLRTFSSYGCRDFLAARLAAEGSDAQLARELVCSQWERRADFTLDGVAVSTVEPGDRVRCGRWSFEVVATPGHTPGHCALVLPGRRMAFTGDALLFACSSFICFWPEVKDSLGDQMATLRRFADMGLEQVFLGHGEQAGDYGERALVNLAHHERRSARALEAIRREQGRTGRELVCDLGWRAIGAGGLDTVSLNTRWFICAESLAHLDHLVELGLIERRADEQGVNRYFPA
ncbi:MBL fold metallo-hydrolase [Paratractidigestivibacter sp.]|uniref:MBL fold metallo-hydrolase n=1 Tax=Paratractidigestivibacter sp. TaxID=2847316 RepID=UPI002ABD4870|nr:MBL fold metallo-hydrolase [Paratractidigestivibacter sp.]